MSNNRTIGGTLDLVALAAPPGVCPNCYRAYRASVPRPAFVHCWHSHTVARQRRDGSWKVLTNVTPDELRTLQVSDARVQS